MAICPSVALRVVHHSERGSEGASLAFGATLRDSGVLASMGSRGDA
jgi:transposase InsO family protein